FCASSRIVSTWPGLNSEWIRAWRMRRYTRSCRVSRAMGWREWVWAFGSMEPDAVEEERGMSSFRSAHPGRGEPVCGILPERQPILLWGQARLGMEEA